MRTRTVLVADDNEDCRTVYAVYLRHCGFDVVEARDGRAALELARACLPDAVVLDFHMPQLSAADVVRALRADAATRDTACLVVTGDVRPATRRAAEEAGADACLLKPVEPRDLFGHLAQLVTARAAAAETQRPRAPLFTHFRGIAAGFEAAAPRL